MIREFMAALTFLTRIPMPSELAFTAKQIGRSARWFPLVGIGIGSAYIATLSLLGPVFPPMIVGLLVVLVEAVITGALHMDGLADMADGFGGGQRPEDILRIMRDHAVGAYGTVALILLVGLKAASIAHFTEDHTTKAYLLLAPAVGRWSAVLMSVLQPYARDAQAQTLRPAISGYVGSAELAIASAVVALPTIALLHWKTIPIVIAAGGTTFAISQYCGRRIGGITGDTLGANTQVIEVIVLLIGVLFPSS